MTKSKDIDQDSSSYSSNKRKRGDNHYDGIEKTQTKQVKRSPELREAHVFFGNPSSTTGGVESSSGQSNNTSSMNAFSNSSSNSCSNRNGEQHPSIIFNINCRVNNSYYQSGNFHYGNPTFPSLAQPIRNLNNFNQSNPSMSSMRNLNNSHGDSDDDDDQEDSLDNDSILTDATDY